MARAANILLVEDNPDDVLLVCKAVQSTMAGIKIHVVGNGQEAIRYLEGEGPFGDRQSHPFPDIVLLDLKMPLVNGFEVLRWLRAQPRLKRLPVIVLSGSAQQSDTVQAYECGANSYLIKPSNFSDLLQTMKTVGDFWLGGTKLPESGAA